MILGLTGGIATGKSTFREVLASLRPFHCFDADRCVHDLLARDMEVISAVAAEFGAQFAAPGSGVDRAKLRPVIFGSTAARQRLEGILHPRVRTAWRALTADCRARGQDLICDIPLLFETNAEGFFDATIVVAASLQTQLARMGTRGLDADTMQAMLASQWPIVEKVGLASHVVWNDGDMAALQLQADLLLELLFP